MENYITLKGIVMSKYNSISEFANICKCPRQKIYRLLSNPSKASSEDICIIADNLDLPEDLFILFFFPSLYTKWTN